MDSWNECRNKHHFEHYPHRVLYQYNSRGFRDQEWPESITELKQAIWCVGDSYTVGLGSPAEHTWANVLQQSAQKRTINVSMDGASNNWIARKTVDILQNINPQHVVIHWSFVARRELDKKTVADQWFNDFYCAVRSPEWPDCKNLEEYYQLPLYIKDEIDTVFGGIPVPSDENCRLHHLPYATHDDDLNNTIECIDRVNDSSIDTKILHSFIPEFCTDSTKIVKHLNQYQTTYVPEFSILDLARDGSHYDILTSQMFVKQIIEYL